MLAVGLPEALRGIWVPAAAQWGRRQFLSGRHCRQHVPAGGCCSPGAEFIH